MDPILAPFHQFMGEVSLTTNLPTVEEAEKIFWGLGDKFWMQIIDFEYHQHGEEVFDKGLHDGVIEPGFFKSLRNGCKFASTHLTEIPTVQFYKDLHKILCAHFKGRENNTEMNSDKVGNFRSNERTSCSPSLMSEVYHKEKENFLLSDFFWLDDESDDDEIKKYLARTLQNRIKHSGSKKGKIWLQEQESKWMQETGIADKIKIAVNIVEQKKMDAKEKVQKINEYLETVFQEINENPYVYISLMGSKPCELYFYVLYPENNNEYYERISQKLFDRYNNKITGLNNLLKSTKDQIEIKSIREQKIDAIADFYQLLEWLHPFQDGQGRTDLVLLAKLLTDEGFNPPILEMPYMSTYSPPDQWRKSLREGIERFKEVKNS